jgi:uridine kinase
MEVICIAGGSGTGKSTVSYALEDKYPDVIEVLNFDDYQKVGQKDSLPILGGMVNWDHPDAIRWNDLISDLKSLKAGKEVCIDVWAHRSNNDYEKTRKMIPRTIVPKPVLVVEGYLALYNQELNKQYDYTYYFDLDEQTRNRRRGKGTFTGKNEYDEKVLNPMFKKYVEPTRYSADQVIDVSNKTVEQVVKILLKNAVLERKLRT